MSVTLKAKGNLEQAPYPVKKNLAFSSVLKKECHLVLVKLFPSKRHL